MALWTRRSGIQLAYPFELKRLLKMLHPWIVQPKLNGERCRALINKTNVVLLSSEENEITTLPHINAAFEKLNIPQLEIDGELYVHGMSKQQIGSYLRRKEPKPDHAIIEYHVFDLIINAPQMERLELLYGLFRKYTEPIREWVKLIESTPVTEFRVVERLLEDYVAEGFEGIILRQPQAFYQRKRTVDMLKWKPRATDSYRIVGFEEEKDKYGTPKGTLGSLVCEKDGQRFSVGSGTLLSRDARINLWLVRDSLIGKWALIEYPELTDRGVPNHPTIVEITDEEVLEDD